MGELGPDCQPARGGTYLGHISTTYSGVSLLLTAALRKVDGQLEDAPFAFLPCLAHPNPYQLQSAGGLVDRIGREHAASTVGYLGKAGRLMVIVLWSHTVIGAWLQETALEKYMTIRHGLQALPSHNLTDSAARSLVLQAEESWHSERVGAHTLHPSL